MGFNIKDKVRFEITSDGKKARWDITKDNGATGKYAEGEVIELDVKNNRFTIVFMAGTDKIHWKFTYKDIAQPGFPKLVPTETQKKDMDALKKWLGE